MNKLLDHLMSCDKDAVQALADACGTKPVYLGQIARGHRKASYMLAKGIQRATKGAVTVHDLRPDIYGPYPGDQSYGMNAIETAARAIGSQEKLAAALGVTPMAVSQWRRRGVPAERCHAIAHASGGAVTVHDLRPDVFGPAPGVPPELPPMPATSEARAA